jgi:hypothetical protein
MIFLGIVKKAPLMKMVKWMDDDELVDYNEDGTAAAADANLKAAYLNDLREVFANKGKEYRAFLKSERVKDLFTSPRTVEMSAEDILAEIPREDLHLIGMVRGMLIMPPSFVHKYLLPTIRMRDALKRSGTGSVPGGVETAIKISQRTARYALWSIVPETIKLITSPS